ncbi:MAG: DUF4435 domain-containing protein [Methylococcaceae bacterium]|nr:DUF4435 domain-containing protein [Methylococcaceae bacterium]
MASLVKGRISSDYRRASNLFQSKLKPKLIDVYVENFDDISFWHNILCDYEKQANIKFNIRAYSRNNFMDGKEGLKKLFHQTGDYFIICLDSDYDYLLAENSDKAQEINSNPYIFQTYAYSIENLKSYAESLNNLCVQATHNTEEIIDFFILIENYSKIIYELFIWNLYFYNQHDTNSFSLKDFCKVIKITKSPEIEHHGKAALEVLEKRTEDKLKQLQQDFPETTQKIMPFSEKLQHLGLFETNTYLFIQGHTLYDNVVLMFLKPVCKRLRKEHEEQIDTLSKSPNEKKERRISYSKSTKDRDIKTLLFVNDKFKNCFLFKKIEQDIQTYLQNFQTTNTVTNQ